MAKSPQRSSIGLFGATMLVVGNTIGVGIFTTSGIVAQHLPSPGWLLAAWALGGLLSLAGALAWAELAALFPEAGGEYVYLREAYGSFWGFLCGWTAFVANFCGSIAVLAIALAEYGVGMIALPHDRPWAVSIGAWSFALSSVQCFAIVVVWLTTLINYYGLRFGSAVQNILGIGKLAAIGGLLGAGFLSQHGSWTHFSPLFDTSTSGNLASAFGLSFIPVMFAYSGWNAAAYIASEVRQPETVVPRALLLGTAITIVAYLGLNVLYVYATPIVNLRGEIRLGELTARILLGDDAAWGIAAVVALSIAGVLNAMVLTGPRVYFSMARDGVFFARAARLHPRFYTPGDALLLQAAWTSLLILSGTFEQLLTYTTVVIVAISVVTVGAVFLLRWRESELIRPYHAWGYPWLPAVYIIGSLGILLNAFWERPFECLLGLGVCVAGVPAYWWWRRVDSADVAA